MTKPEVTLVVVPRERFSYTRESLESIYKDTEYPFELVYVDVCTPKHIQRYLEEKSQEKNFKLVRTQYYISPNQARNVGLRHVQTKYVVFIDNDVVVKRGWLTKLVECAEETGAAVVGPLTCLGQPEHQVIHNAGGENRIKIKEVDGKPQRCIRQKTFLTGEHVVNVPDELKRVQCEYVEFHCMLVRREIFDGTVAIDEGMLATREHIDFCLMVLEAGGTIYCERDSVITTDTLGISKNQKGLMALTGSIQIPDFEWSDIPYFMLRWNDAWDLASLTHLRAKWNLYEDKYFHKRYKGLGGRRREIIIKPLVRRLTFGKGSPWLEKILSSLETRFNHYYYKRYIQKLPQAKQAQAAEMLQSVQVLQSAMV